MILTKISCKRGWERKTKERLERQNSNRFVMWARRCGREIEIGRRFRSFCCIFITKLIQRCGHIDNPRINRYVYIETRFEFFFYWKVYWVIPGSLCKQATSTLSLYYFRLFRFGFVHCNIWQVFCSIHSLLICEKSIFRGSMTITIHQRPQFSPFFHARMTSQHTQYFKEQTWYRCGLSNQLICVFSNLCICMRCTP